MKRYNVIIADDHKMFLDGLTSILASEGDLNILLTAKDGNQVIKFLEVNPKETIDLVITDISMPDLNGIELNSLVKKHNSRIKTLVVSMHNDPIMTEELITNNVDGYVPKNAEKLELIKAIRTLLKGDKYFSTQIKEAYLQNKFTQQKEQEVKLTKREIEVITLIAEEYTTQEIADQLFLSKHTVESYRKNLMAKLNVRNLAGLTKYALRKKYIKA
ncbi:response regulator transcription factor [Aquimarina brevivitae]|uniref:LuxR family two component transcriptional regulator n=1 Tax=Aquimarina brevivitae TaxID=323412 RepID=A0A4Q7NZY3_9FLAO|nr:response regulator transcription factor [Aquimarina brevivitae]RZS93073.1 LuxR family two component transcriptional regulator [Aquimarina brevivitae]